MDKQKVVTKISPMLSTNQNELEEHLKNVEQKDLQEQDFFLCNDASSCAKTKKMTYWKKI